MTFVSFRFPVIFVWFLSVTSLVAGLSYAPKNVTCPTDLIRYGNNGLSPLESHYISQRRTKATQSLQSWLERVNLENFNVSSFLANTSNVPTLGIAFSGGGYRAMLNGAGVFQGLDGRIQGNGNMTGFLQANTYIAGLSGGSWLIGAIAVNDFATIDTMRSNFWHLQDNLVAPSGFISLVTFYDDLYDQVQQKADAGFETTITDYWASALGRQLINRTDGGPETTFSSIVNTTSFQSHDQPFPLVVIDSRRPGEFIINLNSTVYEISPYEFGTWDSRVNLFVPTQYVGSNLTDGKATHGNVCVNNFDNAAFVLGTSSTLFNQILLNLPSGNASTAQEFLENVLQAFSKAQEDIALYPNPFKGINGSSSTVSTFANLTLVDGGEDLQNVPLWPLLQKERNVDFIFAVDSSADTQNWPNGTAFVATYEKYTLNATSDVVFPYVPDQQTFVNLGLNAHPTFFGCNASNFTSATRTPPLVIYFPHTPWTDYTNFSTFTLEYSQAEVAAYINNGVATASQGNSTTWPVCLACAVVQRAKERAGMPIGDQCQQCFNQYCWDGTVNTTANAYNPVLRSDNSTFQTEGQAGSKTSDGVKTILAPGLFSAAVVILGFIFV